MSSPEQRVIKSMALAGITVIILGLAMVWFGLSQWWFEKTHLLGSFGAEMLVYSLWHGWFYYDEVLRG